MPLRLVQLNISLSPTTRKIVLFVPPILLGSIYLFRKVYLLYKDKDNEPTRRHTLTDSDVCDLINSQATTTSLTLNHSEVLDNLDGCVHSSDVKYNRSALSGSNKCAHCRSNQKLSFRESNVYEVSLQKFSTGQLVKFGFDNLNNTIKAVEELKSKTKTLKEYLIPEDGSDLESKLETLYDNLNKVSLDFEIFRNQYMPATYSHQLTLAPDEEDDFDDQASYLSSATTTSLGYWDPEPNLHFFEIYQDSLKNLDNIKQPRTDRTIVTGSESFDDFLAKVHCLRTAFARIFTDSLVRDRFIKIGETILKVILDHSVRDSSECISAYYAFLDYILNTGNFNTIEIEIENRKIAAVSFYDIVLDYMILESFDDLENPPSAVKSVVNNRWLSASFREIALQTAVAAVMRRKRSKLIVSDGFFAHFYSILDHLSPIMAWGFLGTDENLRFKCFSIKESTHAVIRDYFSFDRCRYTSFEDLCDDILRVTDERYWELNNKLSLLNI